FNVGGPGWCNITGSFNTTIIGQNLTIIRNANGQATANITPIWCTVNNTRNPLMTGSTGTYSINTSTAANVSIDQDTAVSADTIVQGYGGSLSSADVQPLSLGVASNTTIDVNFTTYNPIPANATINITFGPLFLLGGLGTCNSMDGSFNTTISGQTITLVRNSDGTVQAASSVESCKINGTMVPNVTGSTGTYTIKTIVSNIVIDNATLDNDTVTSGVAASLRMYVDSVINTSTQATVIIQAQDHYGNNATSSAWVILSHNGSAALDNYLIRLNSGQATTTIEDDTAERVMINATEYTSGTEALNSTAVTVTFTSRNYTQRLNNVGWNTLQIPSQSIMESSGLNASNTGNFNFTSVLSSMGSSWNYMYYNINGSSNGWLLAIRTNPGGSTLMYVNNTNDKPYWINITSAPIIFRI
ncbi:MAG: hypothetical protein QMD85_01815, partial [Candidatus Aenigmarchaeota archaeon]|nr:hypothetical protein [Candidatus Aenigmarchaeota archaeon]